MSDQMIPTPQKRRAPGWMRAAFALSLTLNLLVMGVVGGAVVKHGRDDAPPPGGEILSYGPYTRALSPEDRDALRAALMREAGELRANRQAVRRDFDRVLALLRADPFDRAATEAVLEGQQTRVEAQSRKVRGLVLDHVSAMPPEARHAFADRLDKTLRHGPPRHAPDLGAPPRPPRD